jgi:hypothetical protein
MTTGLAPQILQPSDDRIKWYSGKSQGAQTWIKGLKIVQLTTVGIIPPPGIINIPQRGIDLAGAAETAPGAAQPERGGWPRTQATGTQAKSGKQGG